MVACISLFRMMLSVAPFISLKHDWWRDWVSISEEQCFSAFVPANLLWHQLLSCLWSDLSNKHSKCPKANKMCIRQKQIRTVLSKWASWPTFPIKMTLDCKECGELIIFSHKMLRLGLREDQTGTFQLVTFDGMVLLYSMTALHSDPWKALRLEKHVLRPFHVLTWKGIF